MSKPILPFHATNFITICFYLYNKKSDLNLNSRFIKSKYKQEYNSKESI